MAKKIGVYIHIPFCIQKCYYCDFCSKIGTPDSIEAYIYALTREIDMWKERLNPYTIDSIFIGGGTPSIVPVKLMEKLLKRLNTVLDIPPSCEISIESNPGTLDAEKLKLYLYYGVNRISIGLQAWQDFALKQLGRSHCKKEFIINYELARKIGFNNINVDLMFGLPDQELFWWAKTLLEVAKLQPEHISAYGLNIEDSTFFGQWYNKGILALPSEEKEREMYHYAIDYLTANGYLHYEISNFSVKGKPSLHNLNYWENGEYIGMGLAAHSNLDSVRFSNTEILDQYLMCAHKNMLPIAKREKTTQQDKISETMFLGLRLVEGINRAKFKERFGFDIFQKYGEKIQKLKEAKLLKYDNRFIWLTRRGIDISNQIFIEFLAD